MTAKLDQVLKYHQVTKHQFDRFAAGPAYLDWGNQPDPFRRYRGADVIALHHLPPGEVPPYEPSFYEGATEPIPLNDRSVSQLFYDSLALSAWKRAGDATWALRVNPSSGNLHPTEGYLICGPVDELTGTPIVAHYAAREHALEVRAKFSPETWGALSCELPENAILVGLSSIHWREAWKYGERAFRYCQLDVGHALAAISLAAAGLGWQATLLDDLGTDDLVQLLGLSDPQGAEIEHPDCILALYAQGRVCSQTTLPSSALRAVAQTTWHGKPNLLSQQRVAWPRINRAASDTSKPPTSVYTPRASGARGQEAHPLVGTAAQGPSLRKIIHQRRSAVAMDRKGSINSDTFFGILRKTLPREGHFPFNTLPWNPLVHLVLFVHRVQDLPPGLYVLVRDPSQKDTLTSAMKDGLDWIVPALCPEDLGLYRLKAGDTRLIAQQLSCRQTIASDGCFSLGMIAAFEDPLERYGPWFYRRLFWECGMIGQVLYLEAEAAGVRGTGIGCFFDDAVHETLGLTTMQYQSLYHFTVGLPIDDPRVTTLPAYPS